MRKIRITKWNHHEKLGLILKVGTDDIFDPLFYDLDELEAQQQDNIFLKLTGIAKIERLDYQFSDCEEEKYY